LNILKQKKLLLLGGLRYLLPVIEAAHKLGCFVITCDYLPDNIAHKFSDKYINASIIEKEEILKIAKENKIDGIMSFAVDPGVLTASYVAEKLGLPGCPYESVQILQNKVRFRQFLTDNGFNVPKARGYSSTNEALLDFTSFNFPVIVKPVDAAGSKGVTKVESIEQLKPALDEAMRFSLKAKEIIVEDYIESKGFASDTDSFSINSDLQFVSFNNQFFDAKAKNPYTPAAYSWPALMDQRHQKELANELKRLVRLLKLGTSIYNIEVRVGKDDKPYIMEVSPRGGGNRLSEMLRHASGTDLISLAVRSAIGEPIEELQMPVYNGYWAEIILHAEKDGMFDSLFIDPYLKKNNIIEIDLWVTEGEKVNSFNSATDAIGTLVLRFDSEEEIKQAMIKRDELVKVIVK
jgi:biotin carboxylase